MSYHGCHSQGKLKSSMKLTFTMAWTQPVNPGIKLNIFHLRLGQFNFLSAGNGIVPNFGKYTYVMMAFFCHCTNAICLHLRKPGMSIAAPMHWRSTKTGGEVAVDSAAWLTNLYLSYQQPGFLWLTSCLSS